MKNAIVYICCGLLLVAILMWCVSIRKTDIQQENLYENASPTAEVVDMYTDSIRGEGGMLFYIVAEHASVTSLGDSTTFTIEYKIPWKDYIQIELGDKIVTEYSKFYGWSYITFEKVDE